MYDLLIKDALIIDGSGTPSFVGSAHTKSRTSVRLHPAMRTEVRATTVTLNFLNVNFAGRNQNNFTDTTL